VLRIDKVIDVSWYTPAIFSNIVYSIAYG